MALESAPPTGSSAEALEVSHWARGGFGSARSAVAAEAPLATGAAALPGICSLSASGRTSCLVAASGSLPVGTMRGFQPFGGSAGGCCAGVGSRLYATSSTQTHSTRIHLVYGGDPYGPLSAQNAFLYIICKRKSGSHLIDIFGHYLIIICLHFYTLLANALYVVYLICGKCL